MSSGSPVVTQARRDPNGESVGTEVYYYGFYIGLALRTEIGWLMIPSGIDGLSGWSEEVERCQDEAHAIGALIALGAERARQGREETGGI